MKVEDVIEIVTGLEKAGVTVWVDGGWCVEALVGRRLREHADLDVAVDRTDERALRAWLAAQGFAQRDDRQAKPWNFVLEDTAGRAVDVHVFAFAEDGRHVYGIEYPAESLTGAATLGGAPIHCIAPEWMFRFKTAYRPAPKDLQDVRALADTFGFPVPPSHRGDGCAGPSDPSSSNKWSG